MKKILEQIYGRLSKRFGPQHWWPAGTPFEVIIGAILTQNTAWANVEKAIANLKKENALSAKKLYEMNIKRLAKLIKPSGFYNLKAKRLKHFLNFLFAEYNGNLKKMFSQKPKELREQLLLVKGVGPETADSILLYAAKKPVFVVDAYTKRILSRHKLIKQDAAYNDMQRLFMENLPANVRIYNEYHALLVRLGKELCRRTKPRCNKCPLSADLRKSNADTRR
ncbi:MAG: endonuclease III domain-containing protein [Candidatus Omnitrophota bacterium]